MLDLTKPIDITAINNTADKKKPKISRLMMNSIKTILAYLHPEYNVQSTRDLLTFKEGSIVQPYDSTLANAKDLGVIDKRTLSVDVGMINIKDEIERYRDSYLVTLDELGLKEKQLPFAQWYLETIALVGMQDLHALPWQGVKAVGTDVLDVTDGFLKIIADEIIGGAIAGGEGNYYTLEAAAVDYDASNIGPQLKNQFFLFPEITQQKGVTCHLPYRYKQIYKDWFISEYPNVTNGDVPTEYLDGTDKKCKMNWTTGIGTSKRVTMGTKTNLVYGVDKLNKEFGKIKVWNPNPLLLGAINKLVLGFQIRTLDPREFNCNNLA